MALVGFMLFFIFGLFPLISKTNFALPSATMQNWFLPYGVLLFAASGLVVVPEVRALLGSQRTGLMKRVIICGTMLPGLLYALFALVVIGISGSLTTPDALIGLKTLIPSSFVVLGEVVAILAAFTSYIILGLALKETYFFDLKLSHQTAWALACFIPFVFFLLGFQDFIRIIGFLGAVGIGVDALLTIAVFARAQKAGARPAEYSLNLPPVALWAFAGMFILGIVYEVTTFF